MKLPSQLPILAAMGDKPPLAKSALPLLGVAIAPSFAISYNGSSALELFNLPPRQDISSLPKKRWLDCNQCTSFTAKIGEPPYDQYSWLKEYQPVEKVGKSIWLYYIPEAAMHSPA